jgi:hypothetical protein
MLIKGKGLKQDRIGKGKAKKEEEINTEKKAEGKHNRKTNKRERTTENKDQDKRDKLFSLSLSLCLLWGTRVHFLPFFFYIAIQAHPA